MRNFVLIVILLGVALSLSNTSEGRSTRTIRSPNEPLREKPKPENEPCHEEAPCGWAVYVRFTRDIDYFVYNCKCTNGRLCTREEDDISVTAYVYRCREDNSTSSTATAAADNPTTVSTLN